MYDEINNQEQIDKIQYVSKWNKELVDVGRVGCSSLAALSATIHQSEDTLRHSS
jgi:hypothetical protein